MIIDTWQLFFALLANLLLATFALKKNSVDWSGGIVGFLLGTIIFLALGFWGWFVLGIFFLSSSFLSKLWSSKKGIAEQKSHKGSRRDGFQAFSNAGPGAIAALFFFLFGGHWFLVGFLVSMACGTADTWSSELGVHSRKDPLCLRTFKLVEPGTSGAVSLLGTGAAFIGALVISLSSLPVVYDHGYSGISMSGFIILLGFFGSIVDSFLGAVFQVQFITDQGYITEKPHFQGYANRRIRGIHWMNNDMVNLTSNSVVTILSILISLGMSGGYKYL